MMASGVANPNTRWPPADLLAGADEGEGGQAKQQPQDLAVHAGRVSAHDPHPGQGRAEKEGEGEPLGGPVLAGDETCVPVLGEHEQGRIGEQEQQEEGVGQDEEGGFLHGLLPGRKGSFRQTVTPEGGVGFPYGCVPTAGSG